MSLYNLIVITPPQILYDFSLEIMYSLFHNINSITDIIYVETIDYCQNICKRLVEHISKIANKELTPKDKDIFYKVVDLLSNYKN